jgi:hypothetical protein
MSQNGLVLDSKTLSNLTQVLSAITMMNQERNQTLSTLFNVNVEQSYDSNNYNIPSRAIFPDGNDFQGNDLLQRYLRQVEVTQISSRIPESERKIKCIT